MSIASHHTDWLSLVPVSGPFLSLPVLMDCFPSGLQAHDPDVMRSLRQRYSEWTEAQEKAKGDPTPRNQWIRWVLENVLDYDDKVLVDGQAISQILQVEVPEHHEFLRPNYVLNDSVTGKPRLLVQTYAAAQSLTGYVPGSRWKSSPDTRMTELLHGTGIQLGLVTNGEHWMLVNAPKGETSGYASWYAGIWQEEPITLRAFRSLLGLERFNAEEDKTLEALLKQSASNQQEVTEQLGYQVLKAVEVLIHSLDRADQDFDRSLLSEVPEAVLYESALTVMMRLVFLFCAEERDLIPSKPFPVYDQNYSVSTISKQLRELADQHGEELLERRHDAWPRLLASFRAVYGGLQHDDVIIPAYGGSLFDPDRFPFLEGRTNSTNWRETESVPLPVNNRTVLHLLEALQFLQIRVPGSKHTEARRISFRALDIEQIGHVYEGLLDHTAVRATEPYLGLAGSKNKEPELLLSDLEKHAEKGDGELTKYLKGETGKTEKALAKLLGTDVDNQRTARLRSVCQNDGSLLNRVLPFSGLIRDDTFGYPVVQPKGSVFVTSGNDRRSTGTHYTPRSLTEPIVQYTLEPLVYVGPAEGLPKEEWRLKSAKELLALKICDMACGSGAFLVQVCRYLAARLLEAWENALQSSPDVVRITPEGEPSEGHSSELLIPDDPDERYTYALRIVAQRCIYGVDKNPLAVEMAKLSLWLLTVAKDKPFEFLDHAIRCGDSLVGISSLDQLKQWQLKPDPDYPVQLKGPLDKIVNDAISLRCKLEDLSSNSVDDVRRQEELLAESSRKMAWLRCAADMLVAAEFWGETAKDKQERVRHALAVTEKHLSAGTLEAFEQEAEKERRGQMMFHWPLEFPEVIVKRGGFDGFVGNPPFVGGSRIIDSTSPAFRDYLVRFLTNDTRGRVDLCGYFFITASRLLAAEGAFGFLSTNSISQGHTREVVLRPLLRSLTLYRAISAQPWPGKASVVVALLWLLKRSWLRGTCTLDGNAVSGITEFLTAEMEHSEAPVRLRSQEGVAWRGTEIRGKGFILSPEEASRLLVERPANREVLYPYLGGDDLNSRPDQSASRWVINFHTWGLQKASEYPECLAVLTATVKPYRATITKQIHEPDYWKFWDKRSEQYAAISALPRLLATAAVSPTNAVAWVKPGIVFQNKLVLFTLAEHWHFAVLQSSLHWEWVRFYTSTLGATTLNYSPTHCFETFPMPSETSRMSTAGEGYHNTRAAILNARQLGLTDLYNMVNAATERHHDAEAMRGHRIEMDRAVAAAYEWDDLDLGHGFHETKQGIRFTISEAARREVLQRLLKLNHERYAEEVKQGLHDKKKKKSAKKPRGKKAASKPSQNLSFGFHAESDES